MRKFWGERLGHWLRGRRGGLYWSSCNVLIDFAKYNAGTFELVTYAIKAIDCPSSRAEAPGCRARRGGAGRVPARHFSGTLSGGVGAPRRAGASPSIVMSERWEDPAFPK